MDNQTLYISNSERLQLAIDLSKQLQERISRQPWTSDERHHWINNSARATNLIYQILHNSKEELHEELVRRAECAYSALNREHYPPNASSTAKPLYLPMTVRQINAVSIINEKANEIISDLIKKPLAEYSRDELQEWVGNAKNLIKDSLLVYDSVLHQPSEAALRWAVSKRELEAAIERVDRQLHVIEQRANGISSRTHRPNNQIGFRIFGIIDTHNFTNACYQANGAYAKSAIEEMDLLVDLIADYTKQNLSHIPDRNYGSYTGEEAFLLIPFTNGKLLPAAAFTAPKKGYIVLCTGVSISPCDAADFDFEELINQCCEKAREVGVDIY